MWYLKSRKLFPFLLKGKLKKNKFVLVKRGIFRVKMLANNVGVSRSSRIITIVLLTGLLVIVLCCYRKSGGGGSVNPSKMDPLEIEKAMKGVVGTNQCVRMASCSDPDSSDCELRRVELLKRDEDENRMLFDIEGLTPDDIRTLNDGDGVDMVEENETTTHTITWNGDSFSFTEATEATEVTEATYDGQTLIGTYTNNSSGEEINITKTTTDQKPEALEMYLKDRKAAIDKFNNLANNTEYAVNNIPTYDKDNEKLQWIYNNRDKIVKKTTGTCQGGYCCPEGTNSDKTPAIKDSIVLEDNGNVFLNSYQGTLTTENSLEAEQLTNSVTKVKLCQETCDTSNNWHLYNRQADDTWNAVNGGISTSDGDGENVTIYPLKPNPYAVDNAISDRLNSWSCDYQDDDSIMSDGRQKCDLSGNIELATDNFEARKNEDGSGNVVLKAGGGIGTLGLPCNQHSDCHRFYTNVCQDGHCSAPFMDSTNFMEFPNSRFYTTASPRLDTDP